MFYNESKTPCRKLSPDTLQVLFNVPGKYLVGSVDESQWIFQYFAPFFVLPLLTPLSVSSLHVMAQQNIFQVGPWRKLGECRAETNLERKEKYTERREASAVPNLHSHQIPVGVGCESCRGLHVIFRLRPFSENWL